MLNPQIHQALARELQEFESAVERRLMRALKDAFDPNNLMNPGKFLA